MHSTKERIQAFTDSPQSLNHYVKIFDYEESVFKTMCHYDLKGSQIMFSLNEDGKSYFPQTIQNYSINRY